MGQHPLLGSVLKVLSTIAGRRCVSIAMRRTMWGCRRVNSLGAVRIGLLRPFLPAMVYRWSDRTAFLDVARKRWRSSAVFGRTLELSRLTGRSAVDNTVVCVMLLALPCRLVRCPICLGGRRSNLLVVEMDVSQVAVELHLK